MNHACRRVLDREQESQAWGHWFFWNLEHFKDRPDLRQQGQVGFGLQASWPICVAEAPRIKLPFPVIPIDQVLVSRNFMGFNRRTGLLVGSDHLPVSVELGLKAHE